MIDPCPHCGAALELMTVHTCFGSIDEPPLPKPVNTHLVTLTDAELELVMKARAADGA